MFSKFLKRFISCFLILSFLSNFLVINSLNATSVSSESFSAKISNLSTENVLNLHKNLISLDFIDASDVDLYSEKISDYSTNLNLLKNNFDKYDENEKLAKYKDLLDDYKILLKTGLLFKRFNKLSRNTQGLYETINTVKSYVDYSDIVNKSETVNNLNSRKIVVNDLLSILNLKMNSLGDSLNNLSTDNKDEFLNQIKVIRDSFEDDFKTSYILVADDIVNDAMSAIKAVENVSNGNSSITTSKDSIMPDEIDYATVKVSLLDANNSPIVGKMVYLNANSQGVEVSPNYRFSDSNGEASFIIKSSVTGFIHLNATFDGGYLSSHNIILVNQVFSKEESDFIIEQGDKVLLGENVNVKVIAKDSKGNLIKDKLLDLFINDQSLNKTVIVSSISTAVNGEANFEINEKNLTLGIPLFILFTNEDEGYHFYKNFLEIVNVSKENSSFTVSKSNIYLDEGSKLSVFLKDNNNDLLSGINISLSADSKNILNFNDTAISDTKGLATFTISAKKTGTVNFNIISNNVELGSFSINVLANPIAPSDKEVCELGGGSWVDKVCVCDKDFEWDSDKKSCVEEDAKYTKKTCEEAKGSWVDKEKVCIFK